MGCGSQVMVAASRDSGKLLIEHSTFSSGTKRFKLLERFTNFNGSVSGICAFTTNQPLSYLGIFLGEHNQKKPLGLFLRFELDCMNSLLYCW